MSPTPDPRPELFADVAEQFERMDQYSGGGNS